jgi:hypothetical protein
VKVAATLSVNGVSYPVELEPGMNLLQAVRDVVGLTGSKEGIRPRGAEYERAERAIREYLQDGYWHSSKKLHEDLPDEVPRDWLFGAVKKELRIEHCRREGRYWWASAELMSPCSV